MSLIPVQVAYLTQLIFSTITHDPMQVVNVENLTFSFSCFNDVFFHFKESDFFVLVLCN